MRTSGMVLLRRERSLPARRRCRSSGCRGRRPAEHVERRHRAAAGREHRIDHQHDAAGQLLAAASSSTATRPPSLVALQADVADARGRNQLEHRVEHPEAGAQNRDDHASARPAAGGRPERRLDGDGRAGRSRVASAASSRLMRTASAGRSRAASGSACRLRRRPRVTCRVPPPPSGRRSGRPRAAASAGMSSSCRYCAPGSDARRDSRAAAGRAGRTHRPAARRADGGGLALLLEASPDISRSFVLMIDPMLATGGSAVAALDLLRKPARATCG